MYMCRQYTKHCEFNGRPFFKESAHALSTVKISPKCAYFKFYYHLDPIIINGNSSWTTMKDFYHDCHLDRDNKHVTALEQALLF